MVFYRNFDKIIDMDIGGRPQSIVSQHIYNEQNIYSSTTGEGTYDLRYLHHGLRHPKKFRQGVGSNCILDTARKDNKRNAREVQGHPSEYTDRTCRYAHRFEPTTVPNGVYT